MADIWQQFHSLPKGVRDAAASPEALRVLNELEGKYPGLDLAGLVMRVMVKDVPVGQLSTALVVENKLDQATASSISQRLTEGVFRAAASHLGIPAAPPPPRPTPAQAPAPTTPPAASSSTVRPASTPAINAVQPPPPWARRPSSSPVATPATVTPAAQSPRPVSPLPAPLPPTGANAPTQHYSQEDEAEIAQQTKRVKTIGAVSPIDVDQLAQNIMNQHALAFRDELLQKRSLALLKARLKGIRSSDETKAMFQRAPKVGGLGLDPDMAANVVASLDAAAQGLTTRGAVRPPTPPEAPPPPVVPQVEPQKPSARPPLTRDLPPANLPVAEEVLPNVTDAPRPAPAIHRPPDIPPPPPVERFQHRPLPTPPVAASPLAVPTAQPLVRRERQPERQTMADIVRPTVATMGPAGEMSSLTLAEFRRLGQGAADSAHRLLEKLHHFQKESFTLWSEAVAGWRQSEVYRVYLDMGRQSLEQGVGIGQVEQQRAQQGRPYLSEHEFSVIADLNRQLQA